MKSALQITKEREQRRAAEIAQSLKEGTARLRSVVSKKPEDIGAELEASYRDRAINLVSTFTRSLKTRDENNIRLAYALHMFARYTVPKRIQSVWITQTPGQDGGRLRRNRGPLARTSFMDERRECFFVVGGGGSPHKLIYRDFLSKKEVHRFLTCRHDLDYYRAIFYAIARTFTDNDAVALRIAQSKIGEQDYHDEFWRDAVRFFAAHPIPINEINDLIDYIVEAKRRNADFTLKGRSLVSLTNLMKVWHRELRLVKQIGHHKWDGIALDNWKHETKDGDVWEFTQILNGKKLAEEGSEMHHCVYSYRYSCTTGRIGIFSLTVFRKGAKEAKRALTIEVNEDAEVVQVRGFANRLANEEERRILRQWYSNFNLRQVSSQW
jgi:hypothetical protein